MKRDSSRREPGAQQWPRRWPVGLFWQSVASDDSHQYPGWRPFGGGEWQLVIKVMIIQGGWEEADSGRGDPSKSLVGAHY